MDKLRQRLTVALTAGTIAVLAICNAWKPADKYSFTERRMLAQKPTASVESVLSGSYMSQFEEAAADQFPFREAFRSLKAQSVYSLFRQKDNNGFYITDGHLSQLEYPLEEKKLKNAANKLNRVYEQYLEGTDCSVYLSIIPDKNLFLAPGHGYPSIDADALVCIMRENMEYAKYIDIFGTLSLKNYYTTDQHWRQETILPTAQTIANGMHTELATDFHEQVLGVPFYGAYCGQAAVQCRPDTIRYLTSELLDGCRVTSYDSGAPKAGRMYDVQKARKQDAYDLFLSGADALLTIENPMADTERELVVFRDSFGSSLAPLLASGYAKITVVDLRYIRSELLGNYIDFQEQDVLFLYSTLILNRGL